MSDRYSNWRVWVEASEVRVARDDFQSKLKGGPQLQPQHLEYLSDPPRGPFDIAWQPHDEGAVIPSVSLSDFADGLKEGVF